jgi:hypothetical protein
LECGGVCGNGVKPAGGVPASDFTLKTPWKQDRLTRIVLAMMMTKSFAVTVAALVLSLLGAYGQSYSEYKFIFSGTAYETNASGKLVATPITDQTLLQSQAQKGNITNLSTISIVYHINGDTNFGGDTLDVISNANGQVLANELSLLFGSDTGLGRIAVTNAAQTQQMRVDYIYTFNNSTYTFDNDDSVGLSITSKNFVITNQSTNANISGTMSWGVEPQGTNGPILCIGKFYLGQPMF